MNKKLIKDTLIRADTKLSSVMRGNLSLEPDPQLSLELEKWYVSSEGWLNKVLAVGGDGRQVVLLSQRSWGPAVWFSYSPLRVLGDEVLVREAPKNRGRELIAKALYEHPLYNSSVISAWEKYPSLKWAKCAYLKSGSLCHPKNFKGSLVDEEV